MTANLTMGLPGWIERDGVFEPRLVFGATCCLVAVAGLAACHPLMLGAGAAGLCVLFRHIERYAGPERDSKLSALAGRLLRTAGPYTVEGAAKPPSEPTPNEPAPAGPTPPRKASPARHPESPAGLLDAMIRTGRYALLLKPETVEHLASDEYRRVLEALDERMAITPEGSVLVGAAAEQVTSGDPPCDATSGGDACWEGVARVAPCYLDRCAVTNADYQHFVDAGGYEHLELWPEEALPALFDFVDETDQAGPRFWSRGRFPAGQARLPVVGVSWYEAVAYARWVGKRLPIDAEWTKASAWPIESGPGRIAQRRYPWGDSFDPARANLWCSGVGAPAAVDEYPDGATVGGLLQMIGNTWEWTADTLDGVSPDSVGFPAALRAVRGGAFNTYFENQATCHFQSGEHPLARRGNIGIRLAIDMAALASPAPASPDPDEPLHPDEDD